VGPGIVFHLNSDGIKNWRTAPRFELYRKLADLADVYGDPIEIRRIEQTTGAIVNAPSDRSLHFVHGGSVKGVGWLNSSLSYLSGFWHVDTDGILANSSARNYYFDPLKVRRHAADAFARELKAEFSDQRRSRYNQSIVEDNIPEQCIAVFLQGRYPYANKQHFMSMVDMLTEVLAGSDSYSVLVKPHPLERDLGLEAISRVSGTGGRVHLSHANVHDIIQRAIVVVSVNSSVTFEGFMHCKPAIVFGRTDHSSLVETVRNRGEFPQRLKSALERNWDYSGMLHWYFKNHSIRIKSRRFRASIHEAVQRSGRNPADYRIFQTMT
jgi:hypothetical protein